MQSYVYWNCNIHVSAFHGCHILWQYSRWMAKAMLSKWPAVWQHIHTQAQVSNYHIHQYFQSIMSRGQDRNFLPYLLFTCLLTHSLTPWCRVLLEKLTGLQLVKKFPAFCGTRRFIAAPISANHLSLPGASSIQSIPPHTWFVSKVSVLIFLCTNWKRSTSLMYIGVLVVILAACPILVSTGLVESVVRYCCLCMVVFYNLVTFPMQENIEKRNTSWRSSLIYPPIYAWVFQVVSFPQVSPPKPCTSLSSPPIRAIFPVHLFSIWLPEQYLVSSTDH